MFHGPSTVSTSLDYPRHPSADRQAMLREDCHLRVLQILPFVIEVAIISL
jgi:hypothetical protein